VINNFNLLLIWSDW